MYCQIQSQQKYINTKGLNNNSIYMKNILRILLLFVANIAIGQNNSDINVPLSNPSQIGLLDVNLNFGSITVIGENRNNVTLRYDIEEDDDDNDRGRNGLKRIGKPKAGLEVVEKNNTVKISGNNHNELEILILVPKQFNVNLESHNGDDLVVENIEGEVTIESYNSDVMAKNINGSVNANSYNGDIEIGFTGISTANDMIVTSYNGDVEISLPESSNCEFKLKSQNGELLSDLNLVEYPSQDHKQERNGDATKIYTDSWTLTKLNKGGPEIKITTRNGDIILRKK